MKYKIRDKVKVKQDLSDYKIYGNICFLPQMKTKYITITDVYDKKAYLSEIGFYYSEEMLERLIEGGKQNDL